MGFSAAQGYSLGELNLNWDKRNVYDFDTRIHLLVKGPGIVPGSSVDFLASNVDLAPTFLSLAVRFHQNAPFTHLLAHSPGHGGAQTTQLLHNELHTRPLSVCVLSWHLLQPSPSTECGAAAWDGRQEFPANAARRAHARGERCRRGRRGCAAERGNVHWESPQENGGRGLAAGPFHRVLLRRDWGLCVATRALPFRACAGVCVSIVCCADCGMPEPIELPDNNFIALRGGDFLYGETLHLPCVSTAFMTNETLPFCSCHFLRACAPPTESRMRSAAAEFQNGTDGNINFQTPAHFELFDLHTGAHALDHVGAWSRGEEGCRHALPMTRSFLCFALRPMADEKCLRPSQRVNQGVIARGGSSLAGMQGGNMSITMMRLRV